MRSSNLVLITVVVLGVLVNEAMPQELEIDNNAEFTFGAIALASGLAYHADGQNSGNSPNNGGFGGFLSRRRRQAEEEPLNELDPLVTDLFQMALEKDTKGCSLQLACSVGSRPTSSLNGHAKNLQGVLSKEKAETNTKGPWKGLDAYRVALNLGRDGGNCDQLFPNCHNPSGQLTDAFQNMRTFGN